MSERLFNRKEWEVREISIATARHLVQENHYAGSATNTRVYTHGLYEKGYGNCSGVAWWLPPTKAAAINTFPEGDWKCVLSLTRLVILPGVPRNACSFLLSRSVKMIDKAKWKCLVTYADTWREHTGIIYRASNWEYLGLTKPTPVFVDEYGRMMGRKRGAKNLTVQQLNKQGFKSQGNFAKHKFRLVL